MKQPKVIYNYQQIYFDNKHKELKENKNNLSFLNHRQGIRTNQLNHFIYIFNEGNSFHGVSTSLVNTYDNEKKIMVR
jgi:5,10-methylene-tetrahydrofolate dehydrogenase/methenyl tetrahydrofolate cyclohydrolase